MGFLAAVLAYQAVSSAWYSPALFGKQWLKLTTLAPEPGSPQPPTFVPRSATPGSVTLAVLMAICFRYFLLPLAHMSTVEEAGVFGAFVWLTFLPFHLLYYIIWPCHWKVVMIDLGKSLVACTATSAACLW